MPYAANSTRYDNMAYRRTGKSGIRLPIIALGLWHNFGGIDLFENGRKIVLAAFDQGITHFDLANNYGPPPGSAEENFGLILHKDLKPYRNELIISTKAGYLMWPGPYGEWGSRKYLLASLDQSLKRMGLDYVDIFYSHRPDPDTPLEETMSALAQAVRSGKALYAGLSNYGPQETAEAITLLKDMGVRCLIHQPKYSMFHRLPELGLLDVLTRKGVGCIPFSPLAQGLLTNRYLDGIPADSRAAKAHGFLQMNQVTPEAVEKARQLQIMAAERQQTLSQMALAWLLRHDVVSSVLIGASSVEQLQDNLGVLNNYKFTENELAKIESILA